MTFWAKICRLARKLRRHAPVAPLPPDQETGRAAPEATPQPEPVPDEMLLALQERFRAGIALNGREYRPVDAVARQRVQVTVAKLGLPSLSRDPIIVADGSATSHDGASKIGAAAAVAADGRALVGWWQHDSELTTQFAEFQAIRLALRLAARYPQARVFNDCEQLCERLNNGKTSRERLARLIRCDEPDALGEVVAAMRDQAVSVRWMGRADPAHAGSHPLMLRAHRLAYAVQRMACDGIDPAGELVWLAEFAQNPGRNPVTVRDGYARWLASR
jgi:ribonuclease HI